MSTALRSFGEASPPRHVAVIMDGNGRWAALRGLPRAAGHRKGAEAAMTSIKAAASMGIDYLTLYGFSSENWTRPAHEVEDLMGLLRIYLRSEVAALHENNARLQVIGNRRRLDADIVALIDAAETQTANNGGITVILALSYGAREDIVTTAQRLAQQVKDGDLMPNDIDGSLFSNALSTAGIPDPDLLIRTSGEQRLSNFLLWESAYTEFVFCDCLWPDFSDADLIAAVESYCGRERRFGASQG